MPRVEYMWSTPTPKRILLDLKLTTPPLSHGVFMGNAVDSRSHAPEAKRDRYAATVGRPRPAPNPGPSDGPLVI